MSRHKSRTDGLQISKLAATNEVSIERMFSAFWTSIAIIAVKDLLVRPQTSQLMAELLEITVPEFLKLTQAYTLPWLVLTSKTEIIKKIAQARKDHDPCLTCMEPTNLVRILALLLVQDVPDTEDFIMSLLKSVSRRFIDFNLTDLLRTEPATTALQLLKAAGEADESKKSRIRHALQLLANRAPQESADGSHRNGNTVGLFLERHILGIVARFSEVVNDAREGQSITEKKHCVKAIEEMVKIGKAFTRTARPQV